MKFIWHYYYCFYDVTLTLGAGGEAESAETSDAKKQKLSVDTITKPDEATGGIAKQYCVNLTFGRCDVLCLLKLIVFLGGINTPINCNSRFPLLRWQRNVCVGQVSFDTGQDISSDPFGCQEAWYLPKEEAVKAPGQCCCQQSWIPAQIHRHWQ